MISNKKVKQREKSLRGCQQILCLAAFFLQTVTSVQSSLTQFIAKL